MRLRKGNKEIVFLVLYNNIDKILKFSFAMENLPFPVNNILLQIKCNIFRNAEILHCVRDNCPEF